MAMQYGHIPGPFREVDDEPARLAEQKRIGQQLPTEAEIRAACEELQAGWTRTTERMHLVTHNPRPRIKKNPLTIRFSVKNRSE